MGSAESNAHVKTRVALSVLSGLGFPFCYAIVTGPPSTYVEDPRIRLLLGLPIGWPRLLYSYILSPFIGNSLLDNENSLFLFIIGCDVFLYTFVAYFVLFAFSLFRRAEFKCDAPPPPPDDP